MALPGRAVEPAKTTMTSRSKSAGVNVGGLGTLVLLRLAAGGASRADLSRDLKPFGPTGPSSAALKAALEKEVAALAEASLISKPVGRMEPTEAGHALAARRLGVDTEFVRSLRSWAVLRDGPLTLAAIGADASDPKLAKAVVSPDALRALVVQSAYGISVEKPLSLGKLRTMMAVRALERAFGNQIKSSLGSGGGLAAKPSRLLAGQLLRSPKEYGSDGRLIAALAAEHLGAANGEADTIRAASVRRWAAAFDLVQGGPSAGGPTQQAVASPALVQGLADRVAAAAPLRPANDRGAVSDSTPAPAMRPDLPGFVGAVRKAADRRADGWPGNRKAFICHVWDEVRAAHPQWALSEIEFKGMLAEAHRTGGLVLANADLKDKRFIQEFEKSAIQYKNTVWHFVRVEEP